MKVVIPNTLEIVSSSITESDAQDGPLWSASTTYALGALVRKNHKRYASLADSNTGNDPAASSPSISAKWRYLGATNLYACIDDFVDTQTVAAEGATSLTLTVPFNRATAFGLLNVNAAAVSVLIKDDQDDVYYTADYNMVADLTSFSAYQYCFYPIRAAHEIVATDVPMPILGSMRVTLTGNAPAIGHIVAGRTHYIGETEYKASVGELDYSTKKTDEFGVTTFIRRSYASRMSLPIYLHPSELDAVGRVMRDVRATPCLWIGDNRDNGHAALTVYGWKEDYRSVFSGPNQIEMSLEIQGLI